MDLSSAKLNKTSNDSVYFSGKKNIYNSKGEERTRFFVPDIQLADGEKLGLQFIPFDKKGSTYTPSKTIKPINYQENSEEFKTFQQGKSNYIDANISGLKRWNEYGYRFVIYNKNGDVDRTFTDSVGTPIHSEYGDFTVASTKQGTPSVKGRMYHAFIDSYNIDQKVRESFVKNHFNRGGGNITKLTQKINQADELDQYEYIMTTPIIGGDKSSHGYHPENFFHITRGMGSVEDFINMQVACFNNGKRYVSDGAFTSQGYQGVQLNHAMKWEDSPFKYWFKNPGQNGYQIGVLSDIPEVNQKYTGIRVVNPKNGLKKYNPELPTYIQFYDTRLVSEKQLKDTSKLIESYDTNDAKDPYEITTWSDGVLQNWFEIDPNTPALCGKSYGTLEEWRNSGRLDAILNPNDKNYLFTRRGQVGGTTGWDGNVDLVKSNESNHTNSLAYEEGKNQTRNQIFNVGRYWTELTRDSLIQEIATNLNKLDNNKEIVVNDTSYTNKQEYFNFIEDTYKLERGTLSKINRNLDSYNCNIAKDKRDANTIIQDDILKFPLESLNYSNDLLAVLSTPYITPRPSATGNPNGTKTEILEDARNNTHTKFSKTMDEVYTEIIPNIVRNILSEIQYAQKGGPKIFNANVNDMGELTEYGKYFVEMAMPEIMKFLITESLFGESMDLHYKNGQIDFDALGEDFEKNGNKMNLKKLGIIETSSKNEAEAVAKKIKKGLKSIDIHKKNAFVGYLQDKYNKYSSDEYKMAEAIVHQTGAGLNWRFDAAKDVADWDEVKQGRITSADAWDDVISFWKEYVKNVRQANPSSYIVAEVTSLHDFNKYKWGKYNDANKAERIFYEETGATTGSNYSTFFGAYPKLFGQNVEDGAVQDYGSIQSFMQNAENFCIPSEGDGHSSSEFITGSHVFLDNHDKPRAAHLMAVDSALFWGNFKNPKDKELASTYLKRPYSDNMSSKAVAVAEQYYKYFDTEAKKIGLSKNDIETLQNAITHLANGYQYCTTDETPNFKKAEAFATMPYEITIPHVLKQAQAMGLNIDEKQAEKLENAVFQDMVAPYESKMSAIYELMQGTVGIPTLFAGDEFAQTGCETKSKNWALGCRNPVRHDWVKSKEHVKDFNERIYQAGNLSKQKGLGALADGTPIFAKTTSDCNTFIDSLSKKAIIDGINSVITCDDKYNNTSYANTYKVCSFLDCYKNIGPEPTEEDIVNVPREQVKKELNEKSEEELKTALKELVQKEDAGFVNWVLGTDNIGKNQPRMAEVGAVMKYNDKGENVITMVTNAFMPDNAGVNTLKANSKTKPSISSIVLKDKNGKLIAKPGTIFKRLTYVGSEKTYKNTGSFRYTEEGKLEPTEGTTNATLNSTVTYFYKE